MSDIASSEDGRVIFLHYSIWGRYISVDSENIGVLEARYSINSGRYNRRYQTYILYEMDIREIL